MRPQPNTTGPAPGERAPPGERRTALGAAAVGGGRSRPQLARRLPADGGGDRWYCVMTQPRREAFAFANLARQGFRAWLPLFTRTVRHARKVETVRSALFPRYGFVLLDLARERWRAINGTFGVVGLLMEEDRPRPVPRGVVEHLVTLTGADGVVRYGLEVAPGQRVRILEGPLADRLATVLRLDEKGRVALLLEILGGERTVVVAREAVLPLP